MAGRWRSGLLADIEKPARAASVATMKGDAVIGVHIDVSKAEQIEALAARTMEAFGKVSRDQGLPRSPHVAGRWRSGLRAPA